MRSTKTSATGVDSDGHNEESHNGMEIKDNIDTVDNDDEATRYKKENKHWMKTLPDLNQFSFIRSV